MFNLSRKSILLLTVLFILQALDAQKLFARMAGALDVTFGTGGIALTNIQNGGINSIAIQPSDGKILVGGSNNSFLIVRYNTNGSLDSSFGDGGLVQTLIFPANNSSSSISGLAVQPDGKIVAVGSATRYFFVPPKGTNYVTELAVTRYNPDGSLDTTFDGDGKFTTAFENGWRAEEVALQADGKIVVAGWNSATSDTPTNFVIFRFHPNGTLDTSFDGDGMATTNFFGLDSRPQDLKIQPDGKILAAGYFQQVGGASFAAARFNPNGSLDTTFDGDGKFSGNISENGIDQAGGLALQADGKIILAGFTQTAFGSQQQFGVMRLNAGGTLDTTFDGDGKVMTVFGVGAAGLDTEVQANGRIVVAGVGRESGTISDFGVTRYLPNGAPDTSFDGDGKLTTRLLGSSRASGVAIDNKGKILVAGHTSGSGTGLRAAVVRYNSQSDTFCDFDGDGRADISVFRPSGGNWYILNSSNGTFTGSQFGASEDLIAPADFDGDGKTDISVFRPSIGGWYRLNSSNNTFSAARFGTGGDQPVPGDYDGDQLADIAVFRPSNGTWYRINSASGQFAAHQFGSSGDKAIVGDFDGDARIDLTVFRSTNGTWYRVNSSNNSFTSAQFGNAEDKPVAADYDGDGKTDLAVYRPSNGNWYRINSSDNSFAAHQFGVNEDKPSPADFDGDGKADLVVFRPSSGTWYLLRTAAGFTGIQFGANGDIPTPNAFVR